MPPYLTEKHPPLSWKKLNFIRDLLKRNAALEEMRPYLEELILNHPLTNHIHQRGAIYWRARPNKSANRPFENINDLLWPPAQLIKMGRANSTLSPVLYLARDCETALSEVFKAFEIGVPTHVIGLEIHEDHNVQLAPVGEMHHIHRRTERHISHPEQVAAVRGILAACPEDERERFIEADTLMFEIVALGNSYEISSYIAELIWHKMPWLDGLWYPSRQGGSHNIALRPASYLTKFCVCVSFFAEEGTITRDSMWRIRTILPASKIDEDGNFIFNIEEVSCVTCPTIVPPFTGGGHKPT